MLVRFLFIFLFSTLLFSREPICYSVGLISVKKSNEAMLYKGFPSEGCIRFASREYITLRCDCFDKKADAVKAKNEKYTSYKDAYVVKTKKSRFKSQEKAIIEVSTLDIKEKNTTKKQVNSSVTLLDKNNTINKKRDFLKKLGLEVLNGHIYKSLQNLDEEDSFVNLDLDGTLHEEYLQDINHTFDTNSLATLGKLYEKNFQRELKAIENQGSVYGLSVGAKSYKNIRENNYVYKTDSDWSIVVNTQLNLLKGGYFIDQKRKEKVKLDAYLQYYKEYFSFLEQSYEQKLFHLELVENAVELKYSSLVEPFYRKLLKRSELYIKDHQMSVNKAEYYQEQLESIQILKESYTEQEHMEVEYKLFKLLNNMEELHLKSIDDIKTLAYKNSLTIKSLNTQMKRLSIEDSYYEKVDFNLEAAYLKEENNGWYDRIGLSVNVPLDFFSTTEQKNIQKASYSIQRSTLKISIDQKISLLYNRFSYHQKNIGLLKNELSYLYEKLMQVDIDSRSNNRVILESKIAVEKKKKEIILERLETYKILLGLYKITNVETISELVNISN